jgi:hypothetical protein
MPSKRRPKARRGKQPRAGSTSKNVDVRVSRSSGAHKPQPGVHSQARQPEQSVRERAIHMPADMRRDPSLTFTQAARQRDVDPRSVRKHIGSAFRKDASGRIKARASDQLRQTLYIPSTRPGVLIPVPTKGSRERELVGQLMAALNDAGRGNFDRLRTFPRGQFVGGVRLPTGAHEIQRILEALAEVESPYEGLYRSLARPS